MYIGVSPAKQPKKNRGCHSKIGSAKVDSYPRSKVEEKKEGEGKRKEGEGKYCLGYHLVIVARADQRKFQDLGQQPIK